MPNLKERKAFSFPWINPGVSKGRHLMIETVPAGTVLHGRYRIERVLGSGGFGHVYLAIDLATNQQCAVKEYLVTGTSGQEQLQHEASVLSHLHHPNLPAFKDAFTERDRYYIVLNYIEGNDLTDLIRMARQHNEVVPIRQIIAWLLAVCDAVMFLHRQEPIVIHRDIKPDNIRITPLGTAILVDMGNAKAAADGVRTLFFIRHQGTPGYAPPEQYPGGSGTDARSDIYALGGTLYFALTAHEPPSVSIRNQSLQQGRPTLPSLQECLENNPPAVLEDPNAAAQFRQGVTKPSKPVQHHSRHIAQLGILSPQLLKQLNGIIQKAMELTPNKRYHSVSEFARDLRRVAKALPTLPPSTSSRSVDPNSTQPNFQEVFDTLQAQAAKEQVNNKQDNPGRATPPSAQNSSARVTCPRCGTLILANMGSCPLCGTALSGLANMKMTNMNAKDIYAEQTLLVSPSPFKSGTYTARPQMTSIAASPLVQSSGGVQSLAGDPPPISVATQIPALPVMQAAVLSNQQHVSSQGRQNLLLFNVKLGKRVVLFLIAILVILIGITIALLLHH
jgi:serine/threonine protein kinase